MPCPRRLQNGVSRDLKSTPNDNDTRLAAWDFMEKHKSEFQWDLVVLNPPFVFGVRPS